MISSAPTPFAAIVLAAGKSTRMRSKTPKALHDLSGKPLIRHVLDALQAAGAARIVVVVGHQADFVRSTLGDDVFEYVVQAEQLGTGHAVRMAEPLLGDWQGRIVVVPGDAPLITPSAILDLVSVYPSHAATLLTIELTDPTGYGRILRGDGDQVLGIVEEKDATLEQRLLREVGVSMYAFDPRFLFSALASLSPANAQNEYYLTDTIGIAQAQNAGAGALLWPDAEVGYGINTRIELAEAARLMNRRILETHMTAGVTISDPGTTTIASDVKIGPDTVIKPFTILSGVTDIGEDCVIGPGARIEDCQIGNRVRVRDSWIVASEIGDGTTIGPFANIRAGSTTGKDVKIGDFVELKKTTLADGVSAGHFAYLGDAEVGAKTNIGAGAITCNYDGYRKHKTTIGANAFIGSNSTLVAPVTVGDGAYVAAGSTITDEVPADALGIGRERQTIKDGWAAEKRAAMEGTAKDHE